MEKNYAIYTIEDYCKGKLIETEKDLKKAIKKCKALNRKDYYNEYAVIDLESNSVVYGIGIR